MALVAIELAEAETKLAKLIQDLQADGEILITCNGEPVARLVPAQPVPPDRVPGTARGMFTVPDDFDAPLVVLPLVEEGPRVPSRQRALHQVPAEENGASED